MEKRRYNEGVFRVTEKKEEEVLTKATAIDYCVLISLRWFLFPFYGIFYSQSYGESSIIKTIACELFNGGAEEYA